MYDIGINYPQSNAEVLECQKWLNFGGKWGKGVVLYPKNQFWCVFALRISTFGLKVYKPTHFLKTPDEDLMPPTREKMAKMAKKPLICVLRGQG